LLIVSDFNDYYDSFARYGVDKTCVYKRKAVSEVIESGGWRNRADWENFIVCNRVVGNRGQEFDIKGFVIGFCGNFYPGIRVEWVGVYNSLTFYNKELYVKFLADEGISVPKYGRMWGKSGLLRKKEVDDFFNSQTYTSFEDRFRKDPVFMVSSDLRGLLFTVETCPSLRRAEFYKVKDSYSCFQDIYMYLSGVIGNTEKDMVDISDHDMLYKKGFDGNSFKKPKGAPERKRKKKSKT